MEKWLIGFWLLEVVIFAGVVGFAWADDKLETALIDTQIRRDLVIYTSIISGGGVVSIALFMVAWWAL